MRSLQTFRKRSSDVNSWADCFAEAACTERPVRPHPGRLTCLGGQVFWVRGCLAGIVQRGRVKPPSHAATPWQCGPWAVRERASRSGAVKAVPGFAEARRAFRRFVAYPARKPEHAERGPSREALDQKTTRGGRTPSRRGLVKEQKHEKAAVQPSAAGSNGVWRRCPHREHRKLQGVRAVPHRARRVMNVRTWVIERAAGQRSQVFEAVAAPAASAQSERFL